MTIDRSGAEGLPMIATSCCVTEIASSTKLFALSWFASMGILPPFTARAQRNLTHKGRKPQSPGVGNESHRNQERGAWLPAWSRDNPYAGLRGELRRLRGGEQVRQLIFGRT